MISEIQIKNNRNVKCRGEIDYVYGKIRDNVFSSGMRFKNI